MEGFEGNNYMHVCVNTSLVDVALAKGLKCEGPNDGC